MINIKAEDKGETIACNCEVRGKAQNIMSEAPAVVMALINSVVGKVSIKEGAPAGIKEMYAKMVISAIRQACDISYEEYVEGKPSEYTVKEEDVNEEEIVLDEE